MSTFVYELVSSIDSRWHEVKILIEKASAEENVNSDFYDALCRAAILLIVAHLEGFVKEVAKSLVSDINRFSSFRQTPLSIKRTFCKTFISSSQENGRECENKIQNLIDMLDNLDTKFIVDPFLVESSYGNNRNPSPSVINKICINFGVRNIFSWLNNSALDIVFNGISSEIDILLDNLTSHILESTRLYPYSPDISLFGIQQPTSESGNSRSFWETFLDQLLKNRNDIAHGSLLTNSLSVRELIEFRNKVVLLEYGLVLILCHKSIPSS